MEYLHLGHSMTIQQIFQEISGRPSQKNHEIYHKYSPNAHSPKYHPSDDMGGIFMTLILEQFLWFYWVLICLAYQ